MKKLSLVITSLFLTIVVAAQTDSLEAPYKRFPIFPPVKLLLPDSVSYFTKDALPKKTPSMVFFFSPFCEHCKHETEVLVNNIDKFKGIEIIMPTTMPFDSMMKFRETYQLAKYKNITVGQDKDYFLVSFYKVHYLPFLAFYDKNQDLISAYESGMPMEKAMLEFDKPAKSKSK